jgi:hypothetical protein
VSFASGNVCNPKEDAVRFCQGWPSAHSPDGRPPKGEAAADAYASPPSPRTEEGGWGGGLPNESGATLPHEISGRGPRGGGVCQLLSMRIYCTRRWNKRAYSQTNASLILNWTSLLQKVRLHTISSLSRRCWIRNELVYQHSTAAFYASGDVSNFLLQNICQWVVLGARERIPVFSQGPENLGNFAKFLLNFGKF